MYREECKADLLLLVPRDSTLFVVRVGDGMNVYAIRGPHYKSTLNSYKLNHLIATCLPSKYSLKDGMLHAKNPGTFKVYDLAHNLSEALYDDPGLIEASILE